MPLAPPPLVNVAAPIKRAYPEPRILWPTVQGYGDGGGSDSGAFPSLKATKARMAASPPEALTAFVEAAWSAQDCILVLDDFLFKSQKFQSQQSRLEQILLWFPDGLVANDIRLLTSAHGNRTQQNEIQKLFDERIAIINQSAPRRLGKAQIEIRFSLSLNFPYVHDRFAIIDSEFWHFGATVGGLHNRVSAATRGWNAEAHEAVRFFNEAWDGDGDARRGGRYG